MKQYTQKTYKVIHNQEIKYKENTVCMRENSFYIDTVRDFRDRRYEFKSLVKKYKSIYDEARAQKNDEGMSSAV